MMIHVTSEIKPLKTVLVHRDYDEKADFCLENLKEIFEFI